MAIRVCPRQKNPPHRPQRTQPVMHGPIAQSTVTGVIAVADIRILAAVVLAIEPGSISMCSALRIG
jgi:hypothetical protein